MAKTDINEQEFKKLFYTSTNVTEFAKKLGYSLYYNKKRFSGTTYRDIRRKCKILGLDYLQLSHRNTDKYDKKTNKYDDMLIQLVPECYSIAEVIHKLGYQSLNGNIHNKIKYRITFLGLDTSHFTGQLWSKGKIIFNNKSFNRSKISWNKMFSKNSSIDNNSMMKRLILSGKRKYRCEFCGINTWDAKPIRLRLDHIDGDSSNNEESNLRFLCPNCDSQTSTFCRGQGKKKNHKVQWWEFIVNPDDYSYPLFEYMDKISRYKAIPKNSYKKHYSSECHNIDLTWRHRPRLNKRKVIRPSKEELDIMLSSMSYCAVGRKYGVSDNAIRKWIKSYKCCE